MLRLFMFFLKCTQFIFRAFFNKKFLLLEYDFHIQIASEIKVDLYRGDYESVYL